jgi:hypothetical protein
MEENSKEKKKLSDLYIDATITIPTDDHIAALTLLRALYRAHQSHTATQVCTL